MWVNQLLLLSLLGSVSTGTQPADTRPTTRPAVAHFRRFQLDNGLKVSLITIDNELAFSVFTFMPGGLVTDEPGHVLWSRLIERLSTQLAGKSDGYASTDHLRLESWSRPQEWEETLLDHARLLKGTDFDEHALEVYREDLVVGTRLAEENGKLWNVSQAAFAQAVRQSRTHAAFKKGIRQAALSEVQSYQQRRWGILPGTRLCVISGIAPDTLKDKIVKLFGLIPANRSEPPALMSLHRAPSSVTWDSDNRFAVLGWHLPTLNAGDLAALLVARNLLERHWLKDSYPMYTAFGWDYPAIASFPEGDFFMLPVDAGEEFSSAEEAKEWGLGQIRLLYEESEPYARLEQACRAVSECLLLSELPHVMDRTKLDDRFRLFDRWMGFRRTWAEIEWRYADKRLALGNAAKDLTADRVREVARKYLAERDCIICAVAPGESQDNLPSR